MKKIKNNDGSESYLPGYIYDLGILDPERGTRTPFYVGETTNIEKRLRNHRLAGENANEDSTWVYQTIKEFEEAGIEWDIQVLDQYGTEGPTDKEDEWIMSHLYDGYRLTNMKKGNANWLKEREAVAADMKKRNVKSYKRYKEIVNQEKLDLLHEQWKEEQRLQQIKEESRKEHDKILKEWFERQEEIRKAQEFRNQYHLEQVQKLQAKKKEREEADRPAREQRLRAETERLMQEELARKALGY